MGTFLRVVIFKRGHFRHTLSFICPVKPLRKILEVSGKCVSFCLRIRKRQDRLPCRL